MNTDLNPRYRIHNGPAQPLTETEMREAFRIWYRSYKFSEVDRHISPFLNSDLVPFKTGNDGWLEKARKALFLSTYVVADKLSMGRSTYSEYEEREKNGSISLINLAKIADGMGCELVYAIRPKGGKNFSQTIWQQMGGSILQDIWLQKCDPKRRGWAAGAVAKKFATRAEFKKDFGWSQRMNT